MTDPNILIKIDAAGRALTELRNRAIRDPEWVFASAQYAALLNAFHDLTGIDGVYDAARDAEREAGIPDLPRVMTPVRKLDPAIWGEVV